MNKIISKIHQKMLKTRCSWDMKPFCNCVSGRCFIIGNGPSLKTTDLEKLKNENTFASNRIYGLFDRTDWRPKYYVSQDDGVLLEIKDHLPEISTQVNTMFLNGNIMRAYPPELKNRSNVKFIYINPTSEGKKAMDINILDGIHNGINVSYTIIELAIYMGFREIYLLGIDHNYVTKKNKQGETVLDGNSPANYFEGVAPLKYEARIKETDLSHLMDESTNAYRNAKVYADKNGIKIFNATRGGHLEVFERVDFDTIFR